MCCLVLILIVVFGVKNLSRSAKQLTVHINGLTFDTVKKKQEGIHKMSHEIIGIMDKQQKKNEKYIGLATY